MSLSCEVVVAREIAIIIGAGPAGLTAAYELLDKTEIVPRIFEATADIGGISKTAVYKGNRIDIGGHRFFSKSDRVMAWWQNLLPLQGAPARDDRLLERCLPLAGECHVRDLQGNAPEVLPAPDPEVADRVMLVRRRLSRIFFLRKFFSYPITLSRETLGNLGPLRTARIGVSYLRSLLAPVREEKSLEDFFINRFGRELYRTFFKDYTEKVWGLSCQQIKPAWGAQRVKGLSITRALIHALKRMLNPEEGIAQQGVETSLIGQFLYPKFGPGQMWEFAAEAIERCGGRIALRSPVVGMETDGDRIVAVKVRCEKTGQISRHAGDYFFSSMPVRDLIAAMGTMVPQQVQDVAAGLKYRDFITVGLLLRKLKIKNETSQKTLNSLIPDNWIYIQEPDVKLGRIQIFNNWSPYLVIDPDTVWIGLEYFCSEGDDLWSMADDAMLRFAVAELARIDIIDSADLLDGTVLRMPKAYPAYFGSYEQFDIVREYTDRFSNLFLIGRNGMHRYNNADHSMLTAMTAVENIIAGRTDKSNIWQVNTEDEYHEEN